MKTTRSLEDVARLAKIDALKNVPFTVSYHMMFGRWPKGVHIYEDDGKRIKRIS